MERGHDVSFLGDCPVLLAQSERLKVKNERLVIGNPPVTKWGVISFFWRKREMKRLLNPSSLILHFSPDAVVMLSLSEKILLTPLLVQKGIKVLWIEHDKVGNWLLKNPSLPILRGLSNRVTTVCVSTLSAEIFENLGYNNVRAIPNGVPAPPDDFDHHTFDETLRLGCIARLSPEKGVDLLAEAVRDCENTTLLINGKGDQHIPSTPTITIKADVQNINDIYKHIDVLVLPSRTEDPFGLVVAEAMLRGIAVICTDACGIAEYLESGVDSLVVKAGSVEALKDGIEKMKVAGFRLQVGKKGRETAMREFALETMMDRYEDLLNM